MTAAAIAVASVRGEVADDAAGPAPDIEFQVVEPVAEQERRQIAIATWKTGHVDVVRRDPEDASRYYVYVTDPANLIVVSHVHNTIEDLPRVAGVSSLSDWLAP